MFSSLLLYQGPKINELFDKKLVRKAYIKIFSTLGNVFAVLWMVFSTVGDIISTLKGIQLRGKSSVYFRVFNTEGGNPKHNRGNTQNSCHFPPKLVHDIFGNCISFRFKIKDKPRDSFCLFVWKHKDLANALFALNVSGLTVG